MTTLHDLRRAAEAIRHDDDGRNDRVCSSIASWPGPPAACDCRRGELLATLDAAEKTLQMCKEALDDGFTRAIGTEQHPCLYDAQHVNWVHKELAAFLNPPDDDDAT